MKKINLLLVDDHQIIRDGIKLMLAHDSVINIVAEARNGIEALAYLSNNSNSINIVLMDINMPKMNGIEATKLITNRFPKLNTLGLTMQSDELYISEMVKAGALGYLLKESDTDELVKAIKTVAKGKKYYSNKVSVIMINSLMKQEKTKNPELSKRELEVLYYISLGNTCKEIGNRLLISARTVETHKRNIMEKLALKNTAALIRYAIRNKLVA